MIAFFMILSSLSFGLSKSYVFNSDCLNRDFQDFKITMISHDNPVNPLIL